MDDTRVAISPDALGYLKEQQICERLESMVRHVLHTRPEDPVLAMCSYLNDVNRSGDSMRLGASSAQRASQRSSASTSKPSAAAETPADASATVPPAGSSVVAVAPRQAASPTSSVRVGQTFPGESRRGSAVAHSRGGSASAALHRLDRDDSVRSDVSAFSVTSVDMAEFLADFRAAHFSIFGTMESDMTIDDLADVVDRVALPIPDTRLLSDLFLEMDAALGTGTVPFSAFLARMSYRIAGKYHPDVVRAIFFALAKTTASEEEMAELEKKLDTLDGLNAHLDDELAVRGTVSGTAPSAILSPVFPSKAAAIDQAVTAAPTAAEETSRITGIAINVTLADLLDVTLRGVGIRVHVRQAEELLSKVGVVVMNHRTVTVHIVDVARFLAQATLQNSAHATQTPTCSVQQVPSVGADLCELAVGERDTT